MTSFVILCTGASLTPDIVAALRGKHAIAVSDAWRIAPEADALVSQDWAWWKLYPEALQFAGRKFVGAGMREVLPKGLELVEAGGLIQSGINSGLLAAHVAVRYFGADRVLLFGCDMQGTHYFGRHPAPLTNTPPHRFAHMRGQFGAWKPKGVEVLNCNPASALECFKKVDPWEAIASLG